MEVKKGLAGRRVCGGIQVALGVLFGIGSIYNAVNGSINFLSFFISAFTILTGILGIVGKTEGMIIAYMVTGIICALYFGYAIIASVIAIGQVNDVLSEYGIRDENPLQATLILATVIAALACIVSVIGVITAALPWCGNSQEQDEGQRYSYTHRPATGVV